MLDGGCFIIPKVHTLSTVQEEKYHSYLVRRTPVSLVSSVAVGLDDAIPDPETNIFDGASASDRSLVVGMFLKGVCCLAHLQAILCFG